MSEGLLEIGEVMLAAAQERLETVSANVANATTPGFKSGIVGETAPDESGAPGRRELAAGPLRATGRALDLAISGRGFFAVRGEDEVFYTRAGQFERAGDGRVVDPMGRALLGADGADIVLGEGRFEILSDGVVIENGVPVARLALLEPADEGALVAAGGVLFTAPAAAMREAEAPLLRQGALEGSNVDMAAEMLAMMTALRSAEAGARIVQSYDSLIGQSIQTFGRTR